jgi:hypothetical protein
MLVNIEKARDAAKFLNADDDWMYKVVDHGNGLGSVDIFDYDGTYIGKLPL